MKIILLILFLFFSPIAFSKNITDFEIDNISIGESILNFYKKSDFNNFSLIEYPASDKFYGYTINDYKKNQFKL